MVRVEIISRESIKPSSPTPQHLKKFKLSLLDQLIPAPFAPIVVFYSNNGTGTNHLNVHESLVLLKQSLSETLTRFYPLAGIIENDLCIDCNDQGAYFAVAKVNCNIFQFLNNPNLELINSFLPCEPSFSEASSGARVTNIQVNTFECGGIAIGVCISHKVFDGAALNTFLKAWSGTACGSEKVVIPDFVASSLFPTNELWLKDSSMAMWGSLFKKGKCTTRRFVFDGSAISTLKTMASNTNAVHHPTRVVKTMASNTNAVHHPTRVEVVSAFIWNYAMAASEKLHGVKRSSLLTHVVNLRRRTTPALPDESIGNLIWIARTKCKVKHDELGYQDLVNQVREGISNINGEFVKQMRGDQGAAMMCESLEEIKNVGSREDVDFYGFTSWCKFDFYQADFGWGKPVWVSGVSSNGEVLMNLIVLMDTKCGSGIEAWVTLDEQEMNILEHDCNFLTMASFNPTPV